MKVVSIVGARPEFIQAALISRELRDKDTEILVHTGQHYDFLLSEVFFRDLGLPKPDYNLGVGSASHGKQTGEMLAKIEEVLAVEKPDWVIVRGDTNSTLAGALAAAKLHISLAHVEAGLRSFNRRMPEEINRILTDHMADVLFCPTGAAVQNLAHEGITQGVFLVGDVMYDLALRVVRLAEGKSDILRALRIEAKQYYLVTVHRPENTDDGTNLLGILEALNRIAGTVIFPAHPRTSKAIQDLDCRVESHVRMIDPVGYLDMLVLEENACQILTDSGGVQREAYFLGVPCLTLRSETEWVETVQVGWNVLVGTKAERIVEATQHFQPATERPPVFGDGRASARIVQILRDHQRPA